MKSAITHICLLLLWVPVATTSVVWIVEIVIDKFMIW